MTRPTWSEATDQRPTIDWLRTNKLTFQQTQHHDLAAQVADDMELIAHGFFVG